MHACYAARKRPRFLVICGALALTCLFQTAITPAAAADGCTKPSSPIETDRPDTTNSSIVVPVGSLQNENGINTSRRDGANIFDGTNSRWRLGVAPCFEVLIDIPNYVGDLSHRGPSGFGDVVPALKWQISPVPGKFDLSVTAGAALPTGASAIAGPGVQPYLQFPWSIELTKEWGLSGMETMFLTPADPISKYTNESTFVIGREFGERGHLFVEYVGDYPADRAPSHLLNTGGAYRITPTQQIDFHLGFGLNRTAPAYVFGIGYSFRIDKLFK